MVYVSTPYLLWLVWERISEHGLTIVPVAPISNYCNIATSFARSDQRVITAGGIVSDILEYFKVSTEFVVSYPLMAIFPGVYYTGLTINAVSSSVWGNTPSNYSTKSDIKH